MKVSPAIVDSNVLHEYEHYPAPVRDQLFVIRKLIFKTARSIAGVGPIEETLKWGEPSYLTSESGSGSTIRLAWKKATPDQYGIYFNCKTSIVETIKSLYGNTLNYQKSRAVIFDIHDPLPLDVIEHCIGIALTYHLKK